MAGILRHLVAALTAALVMAGTTLGLAWLGHRGKAPPRKPSASHAPVLVTPPRPLRKAKPPPRSRRHIAPPSASPLPALSLPSAVALPLWTEEEERSGDEVLHLPSEKAVMDLEEGVILTEDLVDEPPRPLKRTIPSYPAKAEERGIEGWVLLRLLIDGDGSVRQATPLDAQPPGLFEEAARTAMLQWRFTPARFRGRPVQVWVKKRLSFSLR